MNPRPEAAPLTDVETNTRLPWEIVETFPGTTRELIDHWQHRVDVAVSTDERRRALVGRALTLYWAVQLGLVDEPFDAVADRRRADVDEAVVLARADDAPDALAEALLGRLMATWGPDHLALRWETVARLAEVRHQIQNDELRLRVHEWLVTERLDHADLDGADALVAEFAADPAAASLAAFRRREDLWRGCVAMLRGRIDEAVEINRRAINESADVAGSPFSFQNVAITVAIERYLRRGLSDVIDVLRSIRASSERVGPNWDTGLTFALSEVGELDEARARFEPLSRCGYAVIPRDLNWLVTMHLCGLIALNLDDEPAGVAALEALRPYGHLDATHGSGYASYGPVARPLASLAARWGDRDEALRWFDHVLTTRQPGPWTSLTRLDRATALRRDDPTSALDDAGRAIVELSGWGLHGWAALARQIEEDLRLDGHGGPVARLRGGHWTLRRGVDVAVVGATVGAAHLVELLNRPYEAIGVAELDPPADPALPKTSSTEPALDPAARAAYRRRIDELAASTRLRATEADELAMLRRQLAGATYHMSTSAELERTRIRVTKALGRTIEAIERESPGLADHLRSSIRTGRRCVYEPSVSTADGGRWTVIRRTTTNGVDPID